MRSPFRAVVDMYNSKFGKNRKKIEHQQAKVKDTKKETGRSTSSSGGSVTAKHVSNEEIKYGTDTYYNHLRDSGYKHHEAKGKCDGVKKRRIKRKMSHKSRRINRLHRQFHKAA